MNVRYKCFIERSIDNRCAYALNQLRVLNLITFLNNEDRAMS